MKVDLSSATDSQEANALGHENDYIKIYSNSWGPSDFGFIIDGPEYYTKSTLSTGVTSVSCTQIIVNIFMYSDVIAFVFIYYITDMMHL